MRPLVPFAVPIALLFAVVPAAGQNEPDMQVRFTDLVDTVPPGANHTFQGRVDLTMPSDADCDDPLVLTLDLFDRPANATATIDPAQANLSGPDVAPGATSHHAFDLHVAVDPNATAYDFLVHTVRVQTGACGNVGATQRLVQLVPRVAFLPDVEVRVDDEGSDAWVVAATNRANAAVRIEWRMLQPSQGRTLDRGEVHLPHEPDAPTPQTLRFQALKGPMDRSETALLNVTVHYDGPHQESRPLRGHTDMVVESRVNPAGGWGPGLLWAAIVLVIGGGAAVAVWRNFPRVKP